MPATYVDTREVPITELKPYPGNPKLHDLPALQESLTLNGQYRSVIARRLPDGTLETLAGHGTIEARAAHSDTIRAEIIEADDEEARRIIAADNQIGARAGYDETALIALLDAANANGGLAGTGWDEDLYADLLAHAEDTALDLDTTEPDGSGEPGSGDAYTTAVNIPQYEPVGPPPPITELRDETRADELRARILGAEIPAEVRDYLLAAAGRHTVFNYRKAAELYPHATPEVQALMEESALVIIDLDDAIRLGYAKLSDTLTELREHDEAQGDNDGE